MTAEIVLMNREAIALAADSAVTMTTASVPKIFTSANKIFTLSKYHPVGIMVYGNAAFMGIPWETIIKIYRNKLSNKQYITLDDYAKNFINFLDTQNDLFPEAIQEFYLKDTVTGYLQFVNNEIKKQVKSRIDKDGQIDEIGIKQIITDVLNKQCDMWKKAEVIPEMPEYFENALLGKYGAIIAEIIANIFENLSLTETHMEQLRRAAISCTSKFSAEISSSNKTGIVVAGFGENDIFPSLMSYDLELIINNRLKYRISGNQKISPGINASIHPFAQSEMVSVFMEGVDPNYKLVEISYISQIFKNYAGIILSNVMGYSDQEKQELEKKLVGIGDQIVQDLSVRLKDYARNHYTNPVINIVAGLPKDELAKMAEALVNLTSFKRRVTPESETVSGPIDVAIISKGDGFIWVKRKHYFQAELNPQFRENYYKDGK